MATVDPRSATVPTGESPVEPTTPAEPTSWVEPTTPAEPTSWVDEVLLAGPDRQVCLVLGQPVDRAGLRAAVAARQERMAAAGIGRGATVALRVPPSLEYVVNLLAAWRAGAQVTVLDHRLAKAEVAAALTRVGAQFVVEATDVTVPPLRGFVVVETTITGRAGRPADTAHALIQLSSGSTGPSKVIGRTAEDLIDEIARYTKIDGVPRPGERVVLLASMLHVLGLVGGLLYGLHAGVTLTVPERVTVDGVLAAIAADPTRTTVIGVPAHIDLLASGAPAEPLPQFVRMTTGGELVRPDVRARFEQRHPAILANMYGMTEVGVIATDLFAEHRPALCPAPGIEVRVVDGELHIARPASPYVGLVDHRRWSDGWLRTRDAATIDPERGLVTIRGRLDSQVSIGGLKVDLSEVEATIAALPAVAEAVISFDGVIEAYVSTRSPVGEQELDAAVTDLLAPYKRPRRWLILDRLPRTPTGKLVRDVRVLRAAATPANDAVGTPPS